MRRLIGTIAFLLAFVPSALAEEIVAEKAPEVKKDARKAKRSLGDGFRQFGRDTKATGRKARQAVITRCADGRHTVKGAAGCRGHGGVLDPK